MTSAIHQFGFLPIQRNLQFRDGELVLLSHYEEMAVMLKDATHTDGFLYPPMQRESRAKPKIVGGEILPQDLWDWQVVPNTERPARLFRLPPSHELILTGLAIDQDLRTRDAGFIMHLCGYLYGHRLQFAEWWFDGRINMKSSHRVHVRDLKAGEFLSQCYCTWKAWPDKFKTHITNLLYMNSRFEVYEWDWERFMLAYMVFDSCYKLAKDMGQVPSCRHSVRFAVMCERYGLYSNPDLFREIVGLRNELFHEGLWDSGQPCSSGGQESYKLIEYLRGINHRLIPALFGYYSEYVSGRWNHLGYDAF